MEKRTKIRLYVDMDNTLCDFSGASNLAKKLEPGIKWPQCQMDFFRNLKPLPGAIETFKKLGEYFDLRILTRPSVENLMCYTEKAVWVRDNLGQEFVSKLILTCDKGEGYSGILIDDMLWEGFDGEQVHFGTEKFPNWETVYKYLIENERYKTKYERWTEKIEEITPGEIVKFVEENFGMDALEDIKRGHFD